MSGPLLRRRAAALCAACALILLVAAPRASADGCPCEPRSLVDSLEEADLFFVGLVIDIVPFGPHPDVWHGVDAHQVTFQVVVSYKAGLEGPVLTVLTPAKTDDCGYPFAVGDAYYVFANRGSESSDFVVAACSGTFSLSDWPEDVVYSADVMEALSTMTPTWMDHSVLERWTPQPSHVAEATAEPVPWSTPTMWDRAVEYPAEYTRDEWSYPPATLSVPPDVSTAAAGAEVRRLPYLPLTLALSVAVAAALAWWVVRSTR